MLDKPRSVVCVHHVNDDPHDVLDEAVVRLSRQFQRHRVCVLQCNDCGRIVGTNIAARRVVRTHEISRVGNDLTDDIADRWIRLRSVNVCRVLADIIGIPCDLDDLAGFAVPVFNKLSVHDQRVETEPFDLIQHPCVCFVDRNLIRDHIGQRGSAVHTVPLSLPRQPCNRIPREIGVPLFPHDNLLRRFKRMDLAVFTEEHAQQRNELAAISLFSLMRIIVRNDLVNVLRSVMLRSYADFIYREPPRHDDVLLILYVCRVRILKDDIDVVGQLDLDHALCILSRRCFVIPIQSDASVTVNRRIPQSLFAVLLHAAQLKNLINLVRQDLRSLFGRIVLQERRDVRCNIVSADLRNKHRYRALQHVQHRLRNIRCIKSVPLVTDIETLVVFDRLVQTDARLIVPSGIICFPNLFGLRVIDHLPLL